MNGLSFPLIFGAGVLSFLSPCVLPLVPPYLTYMSGSSFDQLRADGATAGVVWRKSVFTSIFFILGFSIVFITFGATATAFGQAFRQALPIITPIAGLFIIAMGLHFLGIFRIGLLDRQLRHNGPGAASGPLGGFLLGLAFAVGWTPCIGPILAAILPSPPSRTPPGRAPVCSASIRSVSACRSSWPASPSDRSSPSFPASANTSVPWKRSWAWCWS